MLGSAILESTEPGELLRTPTNGEVWIKNLGSGSGTMWDEVEIRGIYVDVFNFVALHWGRAAAVEFVHEQ